MKKASQHIGFVLLLLSVIFQYSCINNDGNLVDVTAPTIDMHEPEEGAYLEAGTYIHFESTFKDDLELGSYSIDIHDNLDGHGHGRIAEPGSDPSLVKWSFKRNYSIPEGLIIYVAQDDDDIEIRDNAMAGPYHFIVQAVDNAGNSTSFQDGSTVEFEVLITNTSQAVVHITNLENNELVIEMGVLFMVEGDITDPTTGAYAGMHSLEVILGEGHEEDHQHEHLRMSEEEDLIDAYFEGSELNQFMLDEAIQLDEVFEYINFILSQQQLDDLIEEGVEHLQLTVIVRDEQGNLTFSKTTVYVQPN